MKNFLIHKIGGAGLMLPQKQLLYWIEYVSKYKSPNNQIIIVVSALAKTTRSLQDIFEKKSNGEIEKALQTFEYIKKFHVQRCHDLDIKEMNKLYEYFFEIEYFIKNVSINKNNPTISNAYILKFGELMSSEIFYRFVSRANLLTKLVNAQDMIFAFGEDFCNSTPLQPKTSESISRTITNENPDRIILTQGYICNNRLLGLDGSDLTAGLIAFGLKLCNPNCCTELTFWKDVCGVRINGNFQNKIKIDDYCSLETVPVRKDAIITNIRNKTKTRIRSFIDLDHQGTILVW